MEFARFVIVVVITSLSILSLPALAQQEIDPEHFDQPTTYKAAKPVTRGKVSPKAAVLKNEPNSHGTANNGSRTVARQGQRKAESQRVAAVHSPSE